MPSDLLWFGLSCSECPLPSNVPRFFLLIKFLPVVAVLTWYFIHTFCSIIYVANLRLSFGRTMYQRVLFSAVVSVLTF